MKICCRKEIRQTYATRDICDKDLDISDGQLFEKYFLFFLFFKI